MQTTIIAKFLTRSGLVAFEVKRHDYQSGRVGYSYDGKHGAGSGMPLADVKHSIDTSLRTRRGIRCEFQTPEYEQA